MKEISDFLRNAREEKGLSLDDISKETKIQKRHLASLEDGDFSPFSGEVYVKGALRNYAEAVGMNPAEIIALYSQFINKSKDPEEKREKRKRREDSDSHIIIREKKPLPSAALIWIVLVTVVIVGSIWYSNQRGDNDRIPYSSEPFENDKKDEPDEKVFLPVEEPVIEVKLTRISQDNVESVYLLSGADQKQILLTFTGDCWVRIEQDGRLVEEKSFRSGDSKTFGDSNETWIRFGFPPTAGIKVNNLEITDLKQITNPYNITIRKEM